ncbi:MAG: hypothetical protein ACYDCX_06510 [Acidithiobacillus sp.]
MRRTPHLHPLTIALWGIGVCRLDILNLFNRHYNEFEEITSGSLLGGNSAGQVLGLPGAPLTVYGSIQAEF